MFRFKKKITTTSTRRRPGGETAPSAPKSANVFAYRASRSDVSDNLGRGEKKAPSAADSRGQRSWWRRARRGLLAMIALALVMFNLWLSRAPDVVILDVQGQGSATNRPVAAYQMAAQREFSRSVFNTNKVTVNTAAIEASLTRAFPELADVTVSLPLIGNRPTVYVQPSTSRLILTTRTGQALVLDTAGRAVASGDVVNSLRKAGLPDVQDQSALDAQVGDTVLPSSNVAFITEVARQLKAKKVEITGMTLPAGGNELHVRFQGAGYYIKYDLRGDARVEVGSFLALKQYLDSEKKTPAEYIDVRVDNRAYFK